MRILFIAPRLCVPADTGAKIRTLNIVKQIAKYAQVDFVSFSFEKDDQKVKSQLEQLGISVYLVNAEKAGITDVVQGVLFDARPYSAAKYDDDSMRQMIISLLTEKKYDLVHVDHIHMTHYRDLFSHLPCIVDEHNVEFKILERCADVEKSLVKKFLYTSQASKMRTFESYAVERFSACAVVSEDDRRIMSDLTRRNFPIHVIPNGVDTSFFHKADFLKKQQLPTEEDAVVFTGSMDWLPNDDAVVYFAKEILPLIWKKNDKVKFYIVGKSPSENIRNIADKDKRIIVTGRVDDVRDFMLRAKVFVVPIRIGGGTRLKILEAMSMEKPIVSTTVGAEGIAYLHGEDILIADQPENFADTVLSLMKDDARRKRMGVQARDLVCRAYDWNFVGRKLVKIYEELHPQR